MKNRQTGIIALGVVGLPPAPQALATRRLRRAVTPFRMRLELQRYEGGPFAGISAWADGSRKSEANRVPRFFSR